MAKQKVEIKLWSNDIQEVLTGHPVIAEILEDAAEPLEKNLKQIVKKNNASYKAHTKNKNSPLQGGQKIKSEVVEGADRQKVEVSIENAKFSDFKYSSIQKAVSRTKGEY